MVKENDVEVEATHRTEGDKVPSSGSDSDLGSEEVLNNNPSNKKTKKMIQDGDHQVIDVPMRDFEFQPSFLKEHIAFNPFTSLIGIGVWVLAIWCMVSPDDALAKLVDVRGDIGRYFTWFLIIQKPLSFFFILFIAYRFGDVKFGSRDEKPEFTDSSFFAMIFAAGVAVGIFYYGVAEPLYHQEGHWYANAGYQSQDEIDQMSITYTLYHWGFMPWSCYILVAVTAALAAYRFKLPLTFRSCFYPIFGEYTWGWVGDVIDGCSILVTIAGVCTSLGLGAIQITAGIQRLGWLNDDLSDKEKVNVQTILIWGITAIATASVISGVSIGIKYLSQFAFGLGLLLTLIVLVLENTSYLLNLQVQSIGHFFQWTTFLINFHTDAFGQLREGEGRAVDGKAASDGWIEGWTIFYWNWWVSWSCFVGLFVARISRGRTVRELIIYSLLAPFFYCLFWFCIWGGAGLRQSRQALELQQLGEEYFNDTSYFTHGTSEFCYDVPQEDLYDNETLIFTNNRKGITPVCVFESTDASSFNVLYSFSYPDQWESGMGPTLTVLYLFAVAVYFCTSSDSGSLVVDFLASNGRHEHHWLQRLFWALTEGAVATALLNAGGDEGLSALQAAAIIAGLPFTLFLMYLMPTLYEYCAQAADDDQEFFEIGTRKEFSMPVYGGIFNTMEFLASLGSPHPDRVLLGIDRPKRSHVVEFLKGMLVPFVSLYEIVSGFYAAPNQRIGNLLTVGVYTFMHFAWIALFISVAEYPALRAWGWAAFFVNGCMLTGIKADYRSQHGIHGNAIGDFLSSTFIFPQVFAQLVVEIRSNESSAVGSPTIEETQDLIQDTSVSYKRDDTEGPDNSGEVAA